jgi:hypothetical protein
VGFIAMSDASTPEEQNPAFVLVGEFLYHWSYLEHWITEGIKEVLNLESPQSDIILANVSFRDKVSMISTLSHLLLNPINEAKASAAARLFKDIVQFSGNYRNVLMHNSFVPLTGGGIEINRVRAKGKFERPETIWSPEFFAQRFKEIDEFDHQLHMLLLELAQCPRPSDLAAAMLLPGRLSNVPTPAFLQPMTWSPPVPPPEGNTGSPPQSTTPKTDDGTPQGQPRKDKN